MVGFSKKSKVSKKRGTREHGRGKKKGRGAGLRGGRGKAGFHKHKRAHFEKKGQVWGRHGFRIPDERVNAQVGVNVGQLDQSLEELVEQGRAQKDGDTYTVNLGDLGYDKLLGRGQVRNKIQVTVGETTDRATSKIEEAGGTVNAPE